MAGQLDHEHLKTARAKLLRQLKDLRKDSRHSFPDFARQQVLI